MQRTTKPPITTPTLPHNQQHQRQHNASWLLLLLLLNRAIYISQPSHFQLRNQAATPLNVPLSVGGRLLPLPATLGFQQHQANVLLLLLLLSLTNAILWSAIPHSQKELR
jgi:hypothetical protein